MRRFVPRFDALCRSKPSYRRSWPRALLLAAGLVSVSPHAPALGAEAGNICRRGDGKDVSFTLQDSPDTEELHLAVNSDYFVWPVVPRPESVQRALLLWVDVESFDPWPSSHKPGPFSSPFAQYLLHSVRDLEVVADWDFKTSSGYRITDTVQKTKQKGPYGLWAFSAPPPSKPIEGAIVGYQDNFFAMNASGEIAEILRCEKESDEGNPTCKHIIALGPYDLSIQYGRKYLPRWHEISRKSQVFLECLTDRP